MNTLMRKKKSPRGRIGEIGHSVSVHTAEVGQKAREEFDHLAPKLTSATSRGSAALSGLLGEVAPAQIQKMSRRTSGRAAKKASKSNSRGRKVLLLAGVGGALAWLMWWKRSGTDWDSRLVEVAEADSAPVDRPVEGFAGP